MLPNGLKFQPVGRDFVFSHHVMKVVLWLFMRSIARFVSDNKFNEEHTDTHFIYRFCDGNVQAVAEDTDFCVPTISTRAEWHSVNYMIARNKITHRCQ